MALLKHLYRGVSRSCRWRVARNFSSESGSEEEVHSSVSDPISRQIMQAGFSVLKQGDVDSLKQNALNRAAPIDFDKLVRSTGSMLSNSVKI